MSTIPHEIDWFSDSENIHPYSDFANFILEKMQFCYEISSLNDNKRGKIVSPRRKAKFEHYKLLLGGTDNKQSFNLQHSGFGRWEHDKFETKNYRSIFLIPDKSPEEYLNSLLLNAKWRLLSETEKGYDCFIVGENKWYKDAWQNKPVKQLKKFPVLIRVKKAENIHFAYAIIKKENECLYRTFLDEWYSETKEIYRIMYALDKKNETPAVFEYKIKNDQVELHCHSLLPSKEMRIVYLSSWPKKNHDDIFYRIFPLEIWEEIEGIFINLGISLKRQK